jgi:hypothetical protein
LVFKYTAAVQRLVIPARVMPEAGHVLAHRVMSAILSVEEIAAGAEKHQIHCFELFIKCIQLFKDGCLKCA